MIFIWSSWCHCHPVVSCFVKIKTGWTILVSAYPGCPGKKPLNGCLLEDYSQNWNVYIHMHQFISLLFQRSSDYEKLNSMHQVPSFVVDGVTLTQSVSDNELYVTAVSSNLYITAPSGGFGSRFTVASVLSFVCLALFSDVTLCLASPPKDNICGYLE